MSKCRVFMTLKSKSLYWTLFWPKYCARAGGGRSNARTRAAVTATQDGRDRREEGIGGSSESTFVQCVTERRDAGPSGGCVESAACPPRAALPGRRDHPCPVVRRAPAAH